MSWIKQLFASTDKALDILNVGRLIFYTAGGLLAVYPLTMIAGLLSFNGPPSGGFLTSFRFTQGGLDSWPLFFWSLVAGFILATVGFTRIVMPGLSRVSRAQGPVEPNPMNINYLYPLLKDKQEDKDYQAFLISEYFRYVEIAVIVPLGFCVGLSLMGVYALVYLVIFDMRTLSNSQIIFAVVFFQLVVISLALIRYFVWPLFWRPKVIDPTIRTYQRAKVNLVHGIRAIAHDA